MSVDSKQVGVTRRASEPSVVTVKQDGATLMHMVGGDLRVYAEGTTLVTRLYLDASALCGAELTDPQTVYEFDSLEAWSLAWCVGCYEAVVG